MSYGRRYFGSMLLGQGGSVTTPEQQAEALKLAQENPLGGKKERDMDNTLAELAAALCAAQSQMKAATKDSTNPHFRSKYADLTAIWDACREPLTKNGLSVAQLPVTDDGGRVGITTMLMHKSGQSITSTFFVTPAQNTPQGVGSALTYLRRYGLAAMVGVVADDDDDGNRASTPARRPLVAQQAPDDDAPDMPDEPAPAPRKNGHGREALVKRYNDLAAEAAIVGIKAEPAESFETDDELIKAGKALAAKLN